MEMLPIYMLLLLYNVIN